MENGLIVMGDLPKWKKKRVRAQRRTRNEVGLENALPKDGSSKAHLKGGRVRKRTT